ncbi:hypothetical protein CEQ90_14075 [Lewinellaceae bacterium SD302]|nr:hypothetical protein CEQ90_14075 [Lewinellaceae bacterium SD302]
MMSHLPSLVLVFIFSLSSLSTQVSILESNHLGRAHYRVETLTATYLYDPVAGGFSSILDPDGNDWVAYKDKPWGEYPAAAAASFRGLPNLVFQGDDDGAGHPGHRKCSSQFNNNQIFTQSISGKWAWTWTFHEKYASLEVTDTDAERPYWFLYEGPAGGRYRPKQTSWGTDKSGPNYERFDHFKGSKHSDNYRWFYFNGPDSPYTFWMAQAEADTLSDHYSLLGSEEKGVDSADGMVVAGFGRGISADPQLTGPNTFLIGFYKKQVSTRSRHRAIGRAIRKLLR